MTTLDWWALAGYFAVLLGVGLLPTRKASGSTEDFFVSGRRLPWWMAGTSLIAASFASDTPLLVSGLARSKGVWANWLWWGFGISTILAVFLFAPMWRRTGVLTDVELTELRYSGQGAAALRGTKAVYWGLLVNCYTTGAFGLAGLVKVMEAMGGVSREKAIWLCAVLGTGYAVAAGLWGLVLTDMFQFTVAIVSGLTLAYCAVVAAGGLDATLAAVPADRLAILPVEDTGLAFVLPFLLVQWWAWKNTDGSGVMVQRWVSCRDERHATGATIWYALVHYGLRCWPWILVGLASITVVSDRDLPTAMGVPDAEAAFGVMIRRLLPDGVRGLVVAWFFAEFMGAIAQSMSWGGSILSNDVYRRFFRAKGAKGYELLVARSASGLIMWGAVLAALKSTSISAAFTYVIQLTAAIGLVNMLRWVWWRINAWAEITAMVMSPLLVFWLAEPLMKLLAIPSTPMARTLTIVLGGTIPAILASLLTSPDDPDHLREFYRRVRPPRPGWGPIASGCPDVVPFVSVPRLLLQWVLGLALVYGTLFGVGGLLLRQRETGAWGLAAAVLGGVGLLCALRSRRGPARA